MCVGYDGVGMLTAAAALATGLQRLVMVLELLAAMFVLEAFPSVVQR